MWKSRNTEVQWKGNERAPQLPGGRGGRARRAREREAESLAAESLVGRSDGGEKAVVVRRSVCDGSE